jgi:diguanylate cyclase (GGDEF)-like protein
VYLLDLRKALQRWRDERAQVGKDDVVANLQRVRFLCPLIAVINLIGAIALAPQLFDAASDAMSWRWALLGGHLAMVCVMGAFAFFAFSLRHAYRADSTRWLVWACVACGMGIAIFIVSVDQWVTPNITAYVLACMLTGIAVYLTPPAATVLYACSFVAFFWAIGLTQSQPEQLLSNRLNGFMAAMVGWAISVLLWRNFTTITLQQAQLGRVNAELQAKQRDLERLTRLDGLTGLYNRNTFVELTRRELDRAQRQGSATTLLLLDLDHFKRVNDTWGHPAGDAVLKNVAVLLGGSIRTTDLAGRLGGEEFIVLLPNTSEVAARKLAEKVRIKIEATPTLFEITSIRSTVSIGLAGTTALEKLAFDSLYNSADKALYLAKQHGRNRVV